MAMFTAHIAWILQIMAIAAGLVALHHAHQMNAKLIKAAGILLIVFGIGGTLCTGYYAAKYYFHGHYEHAYESGMPMAMGGMMMQDGKMQCPMCAKMMQDKKAGVKPASASPEQTDDHAQHH